MNRRHRGSRASLVILMMAGMLLIPAGPAHAAINCSLASGTIHVTGWSGSKLTVKRNGSNFSFSSTDGSFSSCGGGTMTNVDTVDIDLVGDLSPDHVAIDLSGGQFAPGDAVESSGTSEIEFLVDLGGCSCIGAGEDRLEVVGTTGADIIRSAGAPFGSLDAPPGINLNNDNDLDVIVTNEFGTLRTIVLGGAGNDTLRGQLGRLPYPYRMTIEGGSGHDDIFAGSGNDKLYGDSGNDVVSGAGGFDGLYEGTGQDTLNGGAGDDVLREEDGITAPTTFVGGTGIDTVEAYTYLTDPVSMTLDGQANDGVAGEGDNITDDVENLTGAGDNDLLVGNGGDNELFGGPGNDTLDGRAGADELDGWSGNDVVLQGASPDGADYIADDKGINTISYAARVTGVSIKVDNLANDGAAGEGDDVRGVQNLIGGHGNDVLSAGAGPQSFTGGPGRDTIDYSARLAPVTVTLDGVANDGSAGEADAVGLSIENIRGGSAGDDLIGNAGSNFLFGMEGADRLRGGDGGDEITGGLGDDEEYGNAGADLFRQGSTDDGSDDLYGGPGRDGVDYRSRTSRVYVSLNGQPDDGQGTEIDDVATDIEKAYGGSAGDLLIGNNGSDLLSGGKGKDAIAGGGGADELLGGDGSDRLKGQSGNDDLAGGSGSDVLDGGPGRDRCRGGPGADVIRSCP